MGQDAGADVGAGGTAGLDELDPRGAEHGGRLADPTATVPALGIDDEERAARGTLGWRLGFEVLLVGVHTSARSRSDGLFQSIL